MHRIAVRDEEFPLDDNDGTPASRPGTPAVEVLLVTGDANLREVAARVLASEGYRVRVASHSGHAVLTGLTSRVDVLVAELCAPDISGPALAQRLRRHHPSLRVLFMANPGTPEGLDDVIVRPFTRDDLLARIATSSPTS